MSYTNFFRQAYGSQDLRPYAYQDRLAAEPWPMLTYCRRMDKMDRPGMTPLLHSADSGYHDDIRFDAASLKRQ